MEIYLNIKLSEVFLYLNTPGIKTMIDKIKGLDFDKSKLNYSTNLGYFIGISYAFLWYSSILLGFYFLYAPLLPLLFINRRLYRKITDTLYSSWESFNVVSETF